MAFYHGVWALFGILMIQNYALANDSEQGTLTSANNKDVNVQSESTDTSEHSLQKRYINGLTGDQDMGYPGYPGGIGYFQDGFQDFPEKRHASRWALIHRKLAELENSKRFNAYPMDADINDDKRSPSRWRLIHNRLKQLQKREVKRNYGSIVY